jgi:hypothetical protein
MNYMMCNYFTLTSPILLSQLWELLCTHISVRIPKLCKIPLNPP